MKQKNTKKLLFLVFIALYFNVFSQNTITVTTGNLEKCVSFTPDNSLADFELNIPYNGNISPASILVSFEAYHDKLREVTISLCSPDGTCVKIYDGPTRNDGGDFGNNNSYPAAAYFISDSYASIAGTSVPPGNYKPDEAFNIFDGINPQGKWVLKFEDNDYASGVFF
jgi:hypothetical protein